MQQDDEEGHLGVRPQVTPAAWSTFRPSSSRIRRMEALENASSLLPSEDLLFSWPRREDREGSLKLFFCCLVKDQVASALAATKSNKAHHQGDV